MKYQEIKRITEEWLSETYNLRGITTNWNQPNLPMALSETYKII